MTAALVTYGTYSFWLTLGLGLAAGAFGGLLLGRQLQLIVMRNPLGLLFRAYAELWQDIQAFVPAWLAAVQAVSR